MDSRKRKRIKALIVTAIIIMASVLLVHVFSSFIIPWILSLHGL